MPQTVRRDLPAVDSPSTIDLSSRLSAIDRLTAAGFLAPGNVFGRAALIALAMYGLI
jgi:hypothetical protein